MNKENELIIEQLEIGPMANFTYIIGSRSTREVAIVDPAWDIDKLLDRLAERDYKLTAALATHYHPDHIGGGMGGHSIAGIAELLAKDPVKIYVHRAEASGIKKVTGISDNDMTKVTSGDKMKIGNIEIEFLHTPGHTPGSQCFRVMDNLVSGDTLFINGCGRVDLPGSNSEHMYHSLQKLKSLPENTLLLPGHNYASTPKATIRETREHNPYLSVDNLKTWNEIMS